MNARGAPAAVRNVQICRWKGGAVAPVCLMVDDLANVWIKTRSGRDPRPGDDWGHWGRVRNSSLWWLENRVLRGFKDVRVTFFVTMSRAPETVESRYRGHFGSIAEDDTIADFFRGVHATPRYELAYHGFTHGVSGTGQRPFIQEWESFGSLDEAIEVTNRGREVFRVVTGEYPRGGKYCGYKRNAFSDASIDRCGFNWWCRFDTLSANPVGTERREGFSTSRFGERRLVDLPSTVHGGAISMPPGRKASMRWWYSLLLLYKRRMEFRRHLEFLIAHGLPVLIQEHSARSRTVEEPQTPNIVDDTRGLRWILRWLSRANVWHATCSEIAAYVSLRDEVRVELIEGGRAIQLEGVPEGTAAELSLQFNSDSTKALRLIGPARTARQVVRDGGKAFVTLAPVNGLYRVYEE